MLDKTKIRDKDKSNFIKFISPVCEWQWVYVTKTSTVSVNYPSDGLLPEYTQKIEGLPGGNIYTVEGANHLEVTNMSNSSQGDITRTRFNQIWDRRIGDFFRTNERP